MASCKEVTPAIQFSIACYGAGWPSNGFAMFLLNFLFRFLFWEQEQSQIVDCCPCDPTVNVHFSVTFVLNSLPSNVRQLFGDSPSKLKTWCWWALLPFDIRKISNAAYFQQVLPSDPTMVTYFKRIQYWPGSGHLKPSAKRKDGHRQQG